MPPSGLLAPRFLWRCFLPGVGSDGRIRLASTCTWDKRN
jgi:hypothetical protein